MANEWPWLDGVRRRLGLDPLAPWTRHRMIELLGSEQVEGWAVAGAGDVRPPEDDPAALLEYLVELGILRRRADDRLDVPDPYLYGLGLAPEGRREGRHEAAAVRALNWCLMSGQMACCGRLLGGSGALLHGRTTGQEPSP